MSAHFGDDLTSALRIVERAPASVELFGFRRRAVTDWHHAIGTAAVGDIARLF